MQAWGPAPMAEFEVLVARAARVGKVHLKELLDVYAQAAKDALPGLLDAQRLDIEALARAIGALPDELHEAALVRLIPDLNGFSHTPLAAGMGRAGRLPDGSIAWEVREGPAGVLSRVALLALVGHEARKAQRLRAAFGEGPLDATTWAIAMGQDEATVTAALALTRGELGPWLMRERPPEVRIHPALAPQRWAERGIRSAEKIVVHLAEAGLLGRPLHIWVGPATVTACLSPYTRELRPALTRWAAAQMHPADWQPAGEAPSEDALYAIARDFLRTDPRLLPEKRLAERSVGITHHTLDGIDAEIIDCARLELNVCDARIAPPRNANFGATPPVFLRLDSGGKNLEAACLGRLLSDVAASVQSVTIMSDGAVEPGVLEGAHAVDAVWPWGSAVPIAMPYVTPLRESLARGALLSAPTSPAPAAWGNANAWTRNAGHAVLGASIGTAMLASVLWQGMATANAAWDVGWWHVRGELGTGYSLGLNSIAQHASLSVARLRQLWWPPVRPSAPQPGPVVPEPAQKNGATARHGRCVSRLDPFAANRSFLQCQSSNAASEGNAVSPGCAIALTAWLVSAPATVELPAPVTPVEEPAFDKLDLSVLPVIGYSADDGLGGGLLFGAYWRKAKLLPYKYAIQALLYITDRQVHADGIYFDWLRVNGWPVRIITGALFWATLDDTYCGFGNTVQCSDAVASQAANSMGLTGADKDSFVQSYYWRRYLNPAGEVKILWQILEREDLPKLEAMLSWRGSGYIPGKLGALNPYPRNFYHTAFPDGEPGFASMFQLGFMVDARDQESSPTHGYWLDASVRAAPHFLGSTWQYGGFNTTARTYVPLDKGHTVIWANRFIGDLIFGTPSVAEFSQIGSYSTTPGGLQGFGGPDMGRGIRQNRYLGRIRLMDQAEFRWMFIGFELFAQHIDLTAVGFADAAYIAVDYDNFGGDPAKLIVSEGLGLRIIWDKDFIVRLDAAVSQAEDFGFDAYLNVNNLF